MHDSLWHVIDYIFFWINIPNINDIKKTNSKKKNLKQKKKNIYIYIITKFKINKSEIYILFF